MSKTIYCEKCTREIKYRDDLVTSTIFFEVIPYHEECYAKDLKGAKSLFLNNHPLNGFTSNFGTMLLVILSLIWLIFSDGYMKWTSILLLLPVIYRLYSYLSYERHLEK